MRSLFLSAVLLMTVFAAQAQQNYGIAYQAVARDADGDALENATLDFRFTLTDAGDAAIWNETHNGVMTDEFGLINLTIGSVEGSAGLASVDWALGGFAFQVEINSGDGFEPFGSIAVTAAPVALFASSAPEPKADSLAVVTAQESVDRASADSGLQGQIDGNDADIATNAGAIGTNATAISDEASARTLADSGLQGQIDGNDADIATNAGAIGTNATAISDEASARTSADSGLQGQIDGNDADIATNSVSISTNASGISGNATDIATNAGSISTNASSISGNATDISTNAGAISDEVAARASADSGLQDQIDSNDTDIATNASGISTNATAISDEAADRATADGTLQDNIDAEATARFNNDSFLSGMISANSLADAELGARVTALENESSTAALDAVDSLDTAHSAEILANTSALASETSARIAADGSLQVQIDDNDTDIAANADAISTNATDISAITSAMLSNESDIATNASGISTNAAAISANDTDIATNASGISTNGAAISANDTDIATNASGISTNVAAISANDADIATNASGISTNVTAISNESAARAAGDSDLQDQIDALPNSVPAISAIVEDMLDPTQEGAGLSADGSYFTNTGTNYIETATSLASADELLDAAIAAVQADVDANESASDDAESALSGRLDALEADPTTATAVTAVQNDVNQNEADADQADADLQSEIDATQAGAGLGTDGTYTANATANYIAAVTSLVGADEALDAQAKANADEIAATDYFDQTDLTLHAGAGETWTGIETANGSFTSGMSTGTMTASGDASVGGSLGVTGAATLSSTLDVTGATEIDDAFGVDGNVRIGDNGTSKFSVEATSGTVTLAGDVVALTGGVASGSLTISGSSTLQNVSASSLSVSGLITVPTPTFGSAAANKSYVDGSISTAMSAASAEAWSYKGSADCNFVNGYLVLDESDLAGGAETITVFGADLDAASTFALANEGNTLSLTPTVADGNSLTFDLSHAQAAALSSCTGDLYLHYSLIIDGKNSGLTLFIRVQA